MVTVMCPSLGSPLIFGIKAICSFLLIKMEVGRRVRGRAIIRVADEGLQEEIRTLTTRLVAVEAGRCRDPEGGDDSEEENTAI